MINLSIIVPVHNEADILEKSIKSFNSYFSKHKFVNSFEILVVDNGSSDGTFTIAKELAKISKNIRAVAISTKGLGLALSKGITLSKYSYILFQPIDNPFEFADYKQFIKKIDKKDLIFASKNHPKSIYNAPFTRKLSSKLLSITIKILFSLRLTDTQGTFLGRRKKILTILPKCTSSDAFFQTQLAIYATRFKLKIDEVPVVYKAKRRKSKISLLADGPKLIAELVAEKISLLTMGGQSF